MGIIIQGVDSNSIVRPLLVGSTGGLVTSPPLPSTLFHVQSAWRGFNENLNAPAGTYYVNSALVPAGYILVLQSAFMRNVQRAMAHPYMAVLSGGVYFYFWDIASLALNTFGVWSGQIVLTAGEQISFRFVAVTLNDDIAYGSTGYIMAI